MPPSLHSGGTPEYPTLIQYACDLFTNVRLVSPARVTVPEGAPASTAAGEKGGSKGRSSGTELMSAVLGGRPVVALAFDDMVVSAGGGACSQRA